VNKAILASLEKLNKKFDKMDTEINDAMSQSAKLNM
jgi:hypothetical protein